MIELFKENLQIYLIVLIIMGVINLGLFVYLILRDFNQLTNEGKTPRLKEVLKHLGNFGIWILIQIIVFLLVIIIINAIVYIAKSI